jgi:hypothetical protein
MRQCAKGFFRPHTEQPLQPHLLLSHAGDNIMATRKTSSRKYGNAAGKSVEREMKAMKQGKLKSGRSGKTVTNRKQAIAIGLSEARKAGAKVPEKKSA